MTTLARYAIATSAAAAMLAGCGGHTYSSAVPPVNDSYNALPHHHTFHYTGKKQHFDVPQGVTSLTIVARGAIGGGGYSGLGGGLGGHVFAVVPVQPDETLSVFVGGAGSVGTGAESFNGGAPGGAYPYCSGSGCYGFGGGGASDVREGGDSLADRIIVAGGGGGNGVSCDDVAGGTGGGRSGGRGETGTKCSSQFYGGGGGGDGGTQRKGGSGGFGESGLYGSGGSGSSGTFGAGGSGGHGWRTCGSCYGGGSGGGGGGGYYGGGGGGGGNGGYTDQYIGGQGGGGGGGSGYAEPSATNIRMWRGWKNANTNGLVVISWQ